MKFASKPLELKCSQPSGIEITGYSGSEAALNSMAFNTARIFDPMIAGYLVGWVGEEGCFLINGVSYLAIIFSLFLLQ